MNTHGIDILDRTDDHAVVLHVAHDLQLEFLPAKNRFLDQHLSGRTVEQPPRDYLVEIVVIIRNASASAAHRETGPYDQRIVAELRTNLYGLFHGMRRPTFRKIKVNAPHCLLEQIAVLRLGNDIRPRPDHLYAVALQCPVVKQVHREVQPGLAA